MEEEKLIDVISAFADILENRELSVSRAADLPYPKETIAEAIREELSDPTLPWMADALVEALGELETFLSDDEYELVKGYEEAVKTKKGAEREKLIEETPEDVHRVYQRVKKAREEKAKEAEKLKKD